MLREHGGKHSLFYAVEKGSPEMVEELIEKGADLNEKDAVSLGTCLLRSMCDMRCAFATHERITPQYPLTTCVVLACVYAHLSVNRSACVSLCLMCICISPSIFVSFKWV